MACTREHRQQCKQNDERQIQLLIFFIFLFFCPFFCVSDLFPSDQLDNYASSKRKYLPTKWLQLICFFVDSMRTKSNGISSIVCFSRCEMLQRQLVKFDLIFCWTVEWFCSLFTRSLLTSLDRSPARLICNASITKKKIKLLSLTHLLPFYIFNLIRNFT